MDYSLGSHKRAQGKVGGGLVFLPMTVTCNNTFCFSKPLISLRSYKRGRHTHIHTYTYTHTHTVTHLKFRPLSTKTEF